MVLGFQTLLAFGCAKRFSVKTDAGDEVKQANKVTSNNLICPLEVFIQVRWALEIWRGRERKVRRVLTGGAQVP